MGSLFLLATEAFEGLVEATAGAATAGTPSGSELALEANARAGSSLLSRK
jgi:hypothetical protein